MTFYYSRFLLAFLLLLSALPAAAEGPEPRRGWGRQGAGAPEMVPGPHRPFGDYCPRRHADHYGSRQPVQTAEEAVDRLARYYDLPAERITLRKERRSGYIADILSPDGTLSDRVIIDKWSGRIRSIR